MSETAVRLPDVSRLVVSSSPHYHAKDDVQKIMLMVLLALSPAVVASVCVFGWRALVVTVVCGCSCVAFEHIFCRFMGHESSILDLSALLTGVLLGMNLPATAPLWMCVVGSLIAIGLGKMVYGGLGGNPFNPALVGRVALFLACPKDMSFWIAPNGCALGRWLCDTATGATPLALLKSGATPGAAEGTLSLCSMFLGNVGGSLGETSALALLIGGIFLIAKKIIRWQVPLTYILTVAVFTGIAYLCSPVKGYDLYTYVCAHVLGGGLMLGAFFMATDMVTTPLSRKGGVVFALGCGILTCVIRLWGAFPEGVSFSILIMNTLTPLIDRATAGRPFGVARKTDVEVKA